MLLVVFRMAYRIRWKYDFVVVSFPFSFFFFQSLSMKEQVQLVIPTGLPGTVLQSISSDSRICSGVKNVLPASGSFFWDAS